LLRLTFLSSCFLDSDFYLLQYYGLPRSQKQKEDEEDLKRKARRKFPHAQELPFSQASEENEQEHLNSRGSIRHPTFSGSRNKCCQII